MKFFIEDLFSKFGHIRRIWLHVLKKSIVENVIFEQCHFQVLTHNSKKKLLANQGKRTPIVAIVAVLKNDNDLFYRNYTITTCRHIEYIFILLIHRHLLIPTVQKSVYQRPPEGCHFYKNRGLIL